MANKANLRIHDVHNYFPQLGDNHMGIKLLPANFINFDRPSGLSNMLFFHQVNLPHFVSRCADILEDSVVVAIDGACKSDEGNTTASFGVWFGASSLYNTSGVLPTGLLQTLQSAELYALKIALTTVRDKISGAPARKALNEIVIKTKSKYILESLTKDIWKWEVNKFRTARRLPVVNSEALKEIQGLMVEFEGKGVAVRIWLVEGKYNEGAAGLVRSTGSCGG